MLTVQNRSHDPFYNQAFEEYVYQTFPDEDFFFLWQNAPAVVVGSYQNICREVHVEALRRRGIPVVRRMTGGTLTISAGTMYGTLSKMERDGLIAFQREEENRKLYGLTALGQEVLALELKRIERLYRNSKGESMDE